MSDIRWIEGEIPKPGTCISCGSADHAGRRFMCFSRYIRNYGKVLLCEECVNSVLHLPGLAYVPRIKLEMAETEAEVYRERVEPALDALRNIRTGFDAICSQYLNADGSPKAAKVEVFKRRRLSPVAGTRNPPSSTNGSGGFFDKDPDDAA